MILRWLKSRRARRRKLIFRFHDGDRYRAADPIVVSQRLAEDPEYLPRHLDEARDGDQEALEICGRAACRAFDVLALNPVGQGMTISDRVELIRSFELWIEALKKNTVRSPG